MTAFYSCEIRNILTSPGHSSAPDEALYWLKCVVGIGGTVYNTYSLASHTLCRGIVLAEMCGGHWGTVYNTYSLASHTLCRGIVLTEMCGGHWGTVYNTYSLTSHTLCRGRKGLVML